MKTCFLNFSTKCTHKMVVNVQKQCYEPFTCGLLIQMISFNKKMKLCIEVNGYNIKEYNSDNLFWPSLRNGDLFLQEIICSSRSKLFPVGVDSIF